MTSPRAPSPAAPRPGYCSIEITVTDFGSTLTVSFPFCALAEIGFGATVRGASNEFTLSTFGADVDTWDDFWAYPANLVNQRGAFVLKPNYHGSSNYGLKWAESIQAGKYYELPVSDIEKGVDALIARGLVDADKLGVMGWSNGAILTMALLVHSQRWKAASSMAGGVECHVVDRQRLGGQGSRRLAALGGEGEELVARRPAADQRRAVGEGDDGHWPDVGLALRDAGRECVPGERLDDLLELGRLAGRCR